MLHLNIHALDASPTPSKPLGEAVYAGQVGQIHGLPTITGKLVSKNDGLGTVRRSDGTEFIVHTANFEAFPDPDFDEDRKQRQPRNVKRNNEFLAAIEAVLGGTAK